VKGHTDSGALIESLHGVFDRFKTRMSESSQTQPLSTTAQEANRVLDDVAQVSRAVP
jgi:hypothetical protein